MYGTRMKHIVVLPHNNQVEYIDFGFADRACMVIACSLIGFCVTFVCALPFIN